MRSPDELLLLELSTGCVPLHPLVAFFIVISAPAFVNAIAYEIRHEYQAIVLTKDTFSWPYYFRDRGLARGVHVLLLPELCPDSR